jgi:hypothetical protein
MEKRGRGYGAVYWRPDRPYRFFVAAVGDRGARAGYQGEPELYGRFNPPAIDISIPITV